MQSLTKALKDDQAAARHIHLSSKDGNRIESSRGAEEGTREHSIPAVDPLRKLAHDLVEAMDPVALREIRVPLGAVYDALRIPSPDERARS